MEVANDVKVCGMMHLLVSVHFETKDCLCQTIEDVYHNFTCIHRTIISLIDELNEAQKVLEPGIGIIISFCRFSLRRIIEEDGITIRQTHARLLADIELFFVTVCKAYAAHLSSNCDTEFDIEEYFDSGLFVRIEEAYYEPSPVYCYHLIVNYDLLTELLDQCEKDFADDDNLKESFTVLRNYVDYTKDQINGDNLDKLLVAVENAAYQMARFFITKNSDNTRDTQPEIFRFALLKVLVVLSDSATLMSDELLIGCVKCVQDNLLELLMKHALYLTHTFKCQLKIFHERLSFLIHLLLAYPPKHNANKVMLDFQALVRNIGPVICSCLENPEVELFDLTEMANIIEGDIIKTICCMILQYTEGESPKQDQLGSLVLLLQKLKEFMDSKPGLVVTWKDYDNLVVFISYLILHNIRGGNHTDDDEFSGDTLHLDAALINLGELNKVLISAQVVAFKITCCSLLRRYGNVCWCKLYFLTEDSVGLGTRVRILRAIVLSSNTPLAIELLMAYAECILDSLIEFLSDDVFDASRDKFNIFHEMVPLLGRLLISYEQEHEKLPHIKVEFQDLVRSIGSVICWHFNNRVNCDTATQKCISELSNLVEKINFIIVETEELLHLAHLNKIGRESPKTYQMGSLNSLLQNWEALMECESDLLITWKYHFKEIHENLVLFKYFITNSCSEDDESKELCSSIMDVVHKAKYLLNTFYVGTCPVRCRGIWIIELTKQVEIVKAVVMNANEKKGKIKEISAARKDRIQLSAQALLVPTSTDVVVGFEFEMELIRERLIGPKQLNVIPIVGMPGLGKTTLARKVYEDTFTLSYFDARVWCCISEEYNTKDLFLAILDSMCKLTDEIAGQSETDLSVIIHKELTGRRYFIVLDDVWDINAFMYFKRFFPNDNNGSRIVLTSRSKIIGSQAQCNVELIEPRVLTNEQSWDVLERKVYNKGKCPPELCKIGKEIASSCKGLPLAVVVVDGVLAMGTCKLDFWEEVGRNLTSYLARDSQSQFMAALELSYKFLPGCLKPMFLYLGAFPEDKEISVSNLIRLWIAEGFVQSTELASLEIQAETHLMDLIDRSLVMVAKRRWDGRVAACSVHDLLRDMCLAKAEEEKFMQRVHVHNKLPAYPVMYQRRLSILVKRDDETTSRHLIAYKDLPKFSIVPPIYSILYFQTGQDNIQQEGLGDIISGLKLLKVFDARIFIITQDLLDKALSILVHLRYAHFRVKSLQSIPSSISQLRSLETLIVEDVDMGNNVTVPETIWEMTKLRHLHISGKVWFSAPPENPFILENLQTLYTAAIYLGEEEKIFGKVPGVTGLSCQLFAADEINDQLFPDFGSLGKLESLDVVSYVESLSQLKLPCTLKVLILGSTHLKWSQISMLKTLPNLEVLYLRYHAVDGESWDMGDDDVFTKLKVLKLFLMKIGRWIACADNFPSLEKLELNWCEELEEIPSDLGEIDTLREIKVYRCHESASNIAKAIQKEQEEFGNQLLKFDI